LTLEPTTGIKHNINIPLSSNN